MIGARISSFATLRKMTKIAIFLIVVKENMSFESLGEMIFCKEAKLLASFLEVLSAINAKVSCGYQLSGNEFKYKAVQRNSSKGM